jgi:hypothetical protein
VQRDLHWYFRAQSVSPVKRSVAILVVVRAREFAHEAEITMYSQNSRRAINLQDENLLHASAAYAMRPGVLAAELNLGRGGRDARHSD